MSTKPDTKTAAKPATHVSVILHSASRPGLKFCGSYAVDRSYVVPVDEARRLVNVKGFSYVSLNDKAAAEATEKTTLTTSEA